ncbi:MAG: Stealth CR1 domain-containing protein [Paracoccus sp. (in: a-proteobacteria)]|uniref:Stealth CR1 domain-containing protein n=1 Tax=Paracoccus sp. TaxID=267 RepID=UPI0039E42C9B
MSGIDAVIAWVDGTDPAHAAKRALFAQDASASYAEAVENTRFVESGEIYFCIASILKYAPFIQNIWLITDRQTPRLLGNFILDGLCEPGRIRVVDHQEIFSGYEDLLPTFNSRSIEAILWRIPGLSERFIYFNDDMMLLAALEESDFFDHEHIVFYADRMVQHDRLMKVRLRKLLRRLTGRKPRNRSSMQMASDISSRLVGEYRYSLVPRHQPHPLRVSIQRSFYGSRIDILRRQISYRFRNQDQFLPISLAYLLEMQAGNGPQHRQDHVLGYVDARQPSAWLDFDRALASDAKFLCLQSLDEGSRAFQEHANRELHRRFAGYCPAELSERAVDGECHASMA